MSIIGPQIPNYYSVTGLFARCSGHPPIFLKNIFFVQAEERDHPFDSREGFDPNRQLTVEDQPETDPGGFVANPCRIPQEKTEIPQTFLARFAGYFGKNINNPLSITKLQSVYENRTCPFFEWYGF